MQNASACSLYFSVRSWNCPDYHKGLSSNATVSKAMAVQEI